MLYDQGSATMKRCGALFSTAKLVLVGPRDHVFMICAHVLGLTVMPESLSLCKTVKEKYRVPILSIQQLHAPQNVSCTFLSVRVFVCVCVALLVTKGISQAFLFLVSSIHIQQGAPGMHTGLAPAKAPALHL